MNPKPLNGYDKCRHIVHETQIMNISHKVKTAIFILKNNGLVAFLRALKGYLRTGNDANRPDESRIVFEALEAEGTKGLMIDVGAHWGSALAPFAHSGWEVFCFEPDSENRKRLEYLFGGMPNVVIDARAVSDHPQEGVILYRSEESTGISGLSAFRPSHKAADKVDVTTLKCVFDEQGLSNRVVDFLKIDTEGFDLYVLKGIPWDKVTPRLILCEFEDAKTVPLGYTFHDLANFLQEHGYKLIVSEWYPVKKYNGPHDWRRFTTYPCELENPKGWGNIFALKEDNMYDSLLNLCKVKP